MTDGGERGRLIDGKAVSQAILEEVARETARFSAGRRPPRLTVVIVGENPASQSYVKGKVVAAERCGIGGALVELPASVSEEALLDRVDGLNADPDVDGVLVQLPLPPHIDQERVIERISPSKDVDGFHPFNMGRLAADRPLLVPCTPLGIVELLARYRVRTEGKHAVIVGRSVIVGKPMALLLARKHPHGNATVTMCHSRTEGLAAIVRTADILIAAIGRPGAITADMVAEGAVVIDVGMNRVPDPSSPKGYRNVGDVDFAAVRPRTSFITPVPGGVGPMTIAMLMRNTLRAARWASGVPDEG